MLTEAHLNVPFNHHVGSWLIWGLEAIVFIFPFQPDLLTLRPLLHQQGVLGSLPRGGSRRNPGQGYKQGQEKELGASV